MSMKVLIDMNLSPTWVAALQEHGWEAVHWSTVGNPAAPDREIMKWAHEHGFIVFTHDLDFGALLASTQAVGPSVIQVRAQDVFPSHLAGIIVAALREYAALLKEGALIIVDETRLRARVLPLRR